MKILFLTQLCPYPPSSGSAIRTYNTLKHLGQKHDIRLLTFIRNENESDDLVHLSSYCRNVEHAVIRRSKSRDIAHAAASLLARKSFIIARDHHPEMRAKVMEQLRDKPDIIYVDHLQMFQYIPKSPPCPIILDDHNVEWRIVERFASTRTHSVQGGARIFAALEWRRLRSYELEACRKADLVITVTGEDLETLRANGISKQKLMALPVGVDTDYLTPIAPNPTDRKLLTFGTLTWPPNADAAVHFSDAVYPLIKREVPDAYFTIVGANPPQRVKALSDRDESIKVTGFVDDIRNAARGTAVFVVPIRVGSGMRVKILDAMALGLPVVTTSIGCEGISLEPGRHALVADSPEDFAAAVVSLIRDPDKRIRLASAGRRLVEDLYSWPPILDRLDQAVSRLA